ncbi:MAG: ABC transporter substrate-binding protein [Actinomycetota bacterium]
MALPRRGWVGWIEENSRILGAIAIWVFVLTGGIGALVASASNGSGGGPLAAPSTTAAGTSSGLPSPAASGSLPAGGGTGHGGTPTSTPGGGSTDGGGTTDNNGGGSGGTNHHNGGGGSGGSGGTNHHNGGGGSGGQNHLPDVGNGVIPNTDGCSPTTPKAADGGAETGITSGTVTIGEILSDVSQLPQQFRPTYEGLSAWVNLVNKAGGICKRRIEIQERNDNALPQNYQNSYRSLSSQVFAFVATESLQDSAEYASNAPYNPNDKDPNTGEYVPDVGGLALGYPRAQSLMHAGIFGSLSPTLVGGGAYHYMTSAAPGNQCKLGGVLYLNEPTGASKDQADIGSGALNASWGGNLPSKEYQAPLEAPEPYYTQLVSQMIGDGVNCVFTYADGQSNVNLLSGMRDNGVWPPQDCSAARKAAGQCFYLAYMPFTAVDAKFVASAGDVGSQVTSYMPHVPLDETSNPAVRQYLSALAQCNQDHFVACDGNAGPSTFSVIGYASGVMFGRALATCGGAPTRDCVMTYLRNLTNFDAGGLIAPITPFECTNVNYNGAPWCYKHIFHRWNVIRELGSPSEGLNAFRRVYPKSGFAMDALHIVRGSPA